MYMLYDLYMNDVYTLHELYMTYLDKVYKW